LAVAVVVATLLRAAAAQGNIFLVQVRFLRGQRIQLLLGLVEGHLLRAVEGQMEAAQYLALLQQ
jgi:hypothetical protein